MNLKRTHICPFCEKDLNPHGVGRHLKLHKNLGDKKQIRLKYILRNSKLNEQEIISKYKNGMTLPDLRKETKLDYKAIIFVLNVNNVKRRTLVEVLHSEKTITKRINTCIKKYGKENVLSNGTSIHSKRNETVKTKYGVENVFAIEEIKNKINKKIFDHFGMSLKEHNKKVMKELWKNLSVKEKDIWLRKTILSDKAIQSRKNNRHGFFNSKPEFRVQKLLSKNNINFEMNFVIKFNDRNRRLYDLRICNTNILIEINGDYWHANPEKYKINDYVNFYGHKISVKEIWDKDKFKKELAESRGFKVIYLWDSQIHSLTDSELEKKLLKICYSSLNFYENKAA